MFCTNCGTKNSDEAKFCKTCGKELFVTYVVKEQDTSKAGKEKKHVIEIVLVFIILPLDASISYSIASPTDKGFVLQIIAIFLFMPT